MRLGSAYSKNLVFSHVVKGIKSEITAKFSALRRLRFQDTKRIVTRNAPENVSELSRNGLQDRRNSSRFRKVFGNLRMPSKMFGHLRL